MARQSKRRGGTQRRAQRTAPASRTGQKMDAIALLKADHREVEDWFEQFEKARSDDRKVKLAAKICTALNAHTTIEEEIFYPAFLKATEEKDIHHEAAVEHDGAKRLIAQIETATPDDEYYDAKVTVLSEMIKHHVNEEEKRGGMFAKARQSEMDLVTLGDRLLVRKQALMRVGGDSRKQRELGSGLFGRSQRSRHNGAGRRADIP